jgi:hypothetical protein
MKLQSRLLFISLFITSVASAQFHFGYGLKAGAGTASLKSHGYYNNLGNNLVPSHGGTVTVGAYAGAMASLQFGKVFFIQPELLYSLRGCHNANSNGNFRYHSISLPVMLGFKPVKKICVFAGPEFGYILAATNSGAYQKNAISGIQYRHTLDVDLGLSFSVTPSIAIEGRYVIGVNPLADYIYWESPTQNEQYRIVTGQDGHSRVVQLGITYKLR